MRWSQAFFGGGVAQAVAVAVGSEECFLQGVLCVFVVEREAAQVAVEGFLVAVYEVAELLFVGPFCRPCFGKETECHRGCLCL